MISNLLRNLPDVTKNLLIINVLIFLGVMVFPQYGEMLALHNIGSDFFKPHQLLTHMFMHANLPHLFFNMFALVMFGGQLEKVWGGKKFLIIYFVSGIGSLALQLGINYYDYYAYFSEFSPEQLENIAEGASTLVGKTGRFNSDWVMFYQYNYSTMVGASGAIMGLLAGFGYLFPNTELMLIFLPIPIKAKFFIPILILIDLTMGVRNFEWDNIAHFAHLGGAVAGFLLVYFWNKKRDSFY